MASLSQLRDGAVTLHHLCGACAEARGIRVPPPRAPGAWEVVATIDHEDPGRAG